MTIRNTMTAVGLALGIAAAPVAVMAQDVEQTEAEDGMQTMQSEAETMETDSEGDMSAADSMQSETETETASYDEAEIDAFAEAVIQITEIRNSYAGELQGAEGQEEQQQIMQQANAEMQSAIEAVDGLSVDQYLEIAEAAAQDDALTKRIGESIQTKMQ